MTAKRLELALRRERLLLSSAGQRLAITHHLTGLRPVFSAADAVQRGAAFVRAHPDWIAAGLIAVALLRPRLVVRWARRGFLAWQLARRAAHLLAQIRMQS